MKYLHQVALFIFEILSLISLAHADQIAPESSARSMIIDQFDKASSNVIPPLTQESKYYPDITDKNKRFQRANSSGPVENTTEVIC